MQVLTVNVGQPEWVPYTNQPDGVTGIGKRPTDGPAAVSAPGPKGTGGSGLAGDAVCDLRHHGGDDQAVYAFAREDLDGWERELGRSLVNGMFGENLTTAGVAVTEALVGERWRIGDEAVLQVVGPRIPCRTFQGHLGEQDWVRRFNERAVSGAYLRVIDPGNVSAGDAITVESRPDHDVTVQLVHRALTTDRELLAALVPAIDALHPEAIEAVRRAAAPNG